jgi:hypothetical protein
MSPAVRLCGFLLLVAVLFTAAFAVGAVIGPVSVPGRSHPAGSPMRMGGTGPLTSPQSGPDR